jgi:DNA-binding NarL/FixJ family response regulator
VWFERRSRFSRRKRNCEEQAPAPPRQGGVFGYLRQPVKQPPKNGVLSSHRWTVEVSAELSTRLRRAARARARSPEMLVNDILERGLEQETLRVHAEHALASLTPREQEVTWLAARGQTNHQIADTLVISPETVKSHIHNVLLKFGLRSKSDLRLLLLDLGMRWWQDDPT